MQDLDLNNNRKDETMPPKKTAAKPKPKAPNDTSKLLKEIIAQNNEIIKHLKFQTLMARSVPLMYPNKKAAKALIEEANALFD